LGFSLSSANVGLVSLAQGHEGLSVPSKTFGLMAVGVPVVAVMSPLSEIARIVAEEGCGLVVKPADSQELANTILHLYNNPCELELMGKNAIRAVNTKYNLRSAAKAYYELICSIEGN
jgi:glycosyltransferase involved in cell wall biosynthesis